jgi:hypothetical protein
LNSTNGLSDGGTYNGQITWRSYGSGTDLSGGQPIQISYTESGRLWTRLGTGTTTWAAWRQILNSVDQANAYNMNQNVRTTDSPTFAGLTMSGAIITAGASDLAITPGGNLRVGTAGTSVAAKLQVGGDIRATGEVVAYAASDKNLKDNIQKIESPLSIISKIGGYTFDWNDKQQTYTGKDYGVIAQEIEEVMPELVITRESGYKAVNYEKIVPLLIESIKEQQNTIVNQQTEINELRELINNILNK